MEEACRKARDEERKTKGNSPLAMNRLMLKRKMNG